jgi:hypothetical protein
MLFFTYSYRKKINRAARLGTVVAYRNAQPRLVRSKRFSAKRRKNHEKDHHEPAQG